MLKWLKNIVFNFIHRNDKIVVWSTSYRLEMTWSDIGVVEDFQFNYTIEHYIFRDKYVLRCDPLTRRSIYTEYYILYHDNNPTYQRALKKLAELQNIAKNKLVREKKFNNI